RVSVVFLSSGEAGLPELAPEHARAVREAEAESAAAVLGVERLEFLRHDDSQLMTCVEEVAPELVRLLDDISPSTVYVPHAGENHPDHVGAFRCLEAAAASMASSDAVTYLAYEVWSPLQWFDHVEDVS